MKLYWRSILSLVILFHFAAIIILPLPDTLWARHLGFIFDGYGRALGLNHTWQFFSPNPTSFRYVEYEAYDAHQDVMTSQSLKWPAEERGEVLATRFNRLTYFAILTSITPERGQRYLIGFLCRTTPGAESVSYHVVRELPLPMEAAQLRPTNDFSELSEQHTDSWVSAECPQ